MTDRVKEFIEDYIEEIDLHRWEVVFEAWYETADTEDDFWTDGEDCSSFLSILKQIDMNMQNVDEGRKTVIEIHTEDLVNFLQHNNYNRVDSWTISWSSLIMKLNSCLGFSRAEIFDIFNNLDIAGVTPYKAKEQFVVDGL